MHVVGHVVGVRHDRVQLQVGRSDLGLQPGVDDRRFVEAVGRQERQEVAHVLERGGLVLHHLVDVAVAGLGVGAAELVEADVLTGDVLDHVGPGDEHVALVAHRDHQVRLDRRIHRSPSAFAEDDGDLRHQTGQQLVAAAQLGVPRQRGGRVLDARAGRVVDADDRATDHRAPLHQPGHLAAEHLADRALEHGLVVGEHPDRPAVDEGVPGDHTVAVQRAGIPGGFASAPISKKLPGSTSAWTRARALGMPFLSRFAAAFSPPGSLANSRRPRSSASFSAVVWTVAAGPEARAEASTYRSLAYLALGSSASMLSSARLMCSPTLAMIGSSMAWMCSPPIGTTSRSETYSPQPPSGWRTAYRGSNMIASSW